jgi:hypothetical protein
MPTYVARHGVLLPTWDVGSVWGVECQVRVLRWELVVMEVAQAFGEQTLFPDEGLFPPWQQALQLAHG